MYSRNQEAGLKLASVEQTFLERLELALVPFADEVAHGAISARRCSIGLPKRGHRYHNDLKL